MRPKGRLKSKKMGPADETKRVEAALGFPGTQVPGCTRTALYPDMFDEAYPDTSNGTRYHTFVESTSLGPVSVPGYRYLWWYCIFLCCLPNLWAARP